MRSASFVTLSAMASLAWAEPSLGTKSEPLRSVAGAGGAGSVGLMALVQMLVALAIVLGIVKWALPKFAGAFNRRLAPGLGSSIKIEETAAFAGGNLYVVSVRGRELLLSASQSGVACLADLTVGERAAAQAGFDEMLEAARGEFPGAVRSTAEHARRPGSTPESGAVSEALERLAANDRGQGSDASRDPDAVADALRRLERLAR